MKAIFTMESKSEWPVFLCANKDCEREFTIGIILTDETDTKFVMIPGYNEAKKRIHCPFCGTRLINENDI